MTEAAARPPVPLPVAATLDPDNPVEALRSVGAAFGRTRLRTLISLRWMAIAGQAGAVLFVNYGLGFDLPLAACLAAVGASAWLNVALMAVFPSQHLSSPAETAGQLAFDTVQLSVLIGLTGGLENPFLLMILAPVTVGASRLLPAYAGALALLALVCCGAMWFWGLDLPWVRGAPIDIPPLYQAGQLAAVGIGLIFFTVSAWRTGRDESHLVSALDAVQAVLAREQQLSALGALAAATAHELGTPLATIALVARELDRAMPKDSPHAEDIALMRSQVERCRDILSKLTSLGAGYAGPLTDFAIGDLIEEVVAPHRAFGIEIDIELDGQAPEPMCRRNAGVLYGLGNLVENAVDHADTAVRVIARWDDREVLIRIEDDGPGFRSDLLPRLGEPYLHRRGRKAREGGLGLGLFIARTLLERSGAKIRFGNASPPERGARAQALWARSDFETDRPEAGV